MSSERRSTSTRPAGRPANRTGDRPTGQSGRPRPSGPPRVGGRPGSGAPARGRSNTNDAPRYRRDGASSTGAASRGGSDRPRSPRPSGDRPYTPRSTSDRARHERPSGDRPYKPRAGSDRPRAPRPAGDRPYTPRAGSDRSRAPRPGGDRPYTPRATGERPRFERPSGDRPYKPRAGSDRPRAPRPGGDRPYTPRATGERPRYERRGGDRPYKPRTGSDRPRAPRPGGDRPYTPRATGERPRFERPSADRPRAPRPGGDRPYTPRATGDRPRLERPTDERARAPRPEIAEDGGDQTGAVNRSRPIFPRAGQVRYRRDGKPSAPPAGWNGGREDRGAPVSNGPTAPRGKPWTGATTVREERRGSAPFNTEGHSLPSDPREAALRILHAVDTRSAFSDRLLDGAHARAGADPRDRALLHELVKGSLRWRGRIDAALDARIHVGLANTQPWIRNILRIGAYQILFLDRVPIHAAVDESVKLAHKYSHPGAAGLVNSVLRRLAEERDKIQWPEGEDAVSLAAWGSHPLWIVERWLARFGPADTRALLAADNRTVPTGLRANTLRNSREELVELLAREGVEARPAVLSPDLVWVEGHHSPGALHCFKAGLCTAQDESEALVARVVAPRPHERVLDLCAAPGGKSTHLAELMGDEGEVWALERDAHRVETLKNTVARLGVHAVHVVHGDGRDYPFPMPFDRILVDAPCSGMGVLARRADARWRKGPEVLAEMPPVQLELLNAASRHLAPGGRLVYSVCSFEPEETDHVVARFLAEHPGWTLESVAGSVPDAVVTPEGTMRVLPHRHGCDGAFAARFRKP